MADEIPAAGAGQRINAGLGSADGDAARRHVQAGLGQARGGQLRIKPIQIRKARREADQIDPIFGCAVALDDLGGGKTGMFGHPFEVCAAVADGNGA